MAKAKPKKRNPQDATLRNIKATRTAVAALAARVKALETTVRKLSKRGYIDTGIIYGPR